MRIAQALTSTSRARLAVIAAVLSAPGAVIPASAVAATASLRASDAAGSRAGLLYQAAAGEPNDVTVTREHAENPPRPGTSEWFVTISDAGAAITAGASCVAVDAQTVRCRVSGELPVIAELGDANDRLRVPPPPAGPGGQGIGIEAFGGPGDDVLDFRPGGTGVLDGGGGRDELYGGLGPDFLTDGDREGAPGDAGPGPDVMVGGSPYDDDLVGYHRRAKPLVVDLARPGVAGERGEGDVIRGDRIGVVGGSGADYLAGNDGENHILGGGGRDTLIGRGGQDTFALPIYPPPPAGWPPYVAALGATATRDDSVLCGAGAADTLERPSSRTYVAPTCEWVAGFPEYLPAYPARRRSVLTYRVTCVAEIDRESSERRCGPGTVTLRSTSRNDRLLARGRIPSGGEDLVARLRLTPAGRRVAARGRPVRTQIRVSAKNFGTGKWTIRLRLPR